MAGRLTIAPFAAVTIDPNGDGDVNWAMNPFGNPTWGQDFRSGGWIEDLVAAYLAGGPEASAYQARAKQLAALAQAFPPSGRDPQTLVCIAQAFPGQAWINDQIPPTVDYYAAHWMGAWNHGLMQDIELLTIGCGYPPGAFGGDALRWRRRRRAAHRRVRAEPAGPPSTRRARSTSRRPYTRTSSTPCGRPRCRRWPPADTSYRAGSRPGSRSSGLPRVRHRARR